MKLENYCPICDLKYFPTKHDHTCPWCESSKGASRVVMAVCVFIILAVAYFAIALLL